MMELDSGNFFLRYIRIFEKETVLPELRIRYQWKFPRKSRVKIEKKELGSP